MKSIHLTDNELLIGNILVAILIIVIFVYFILLSKNIIKRCEDYYKRKTKTK